MSSEVGCLLALLTAVGFRVNLLACRRLQETRSTPFETYAINRYALLPALLWSAVFVSGDDLEQIVGSPALFGLFALMWVLWNAQAWLMVLLVNSTSSMLLLTTLFTVVLLPGSLVGGMLINGDPVGVASALAIGVLVLAVVIRPEAHEANLRPVLSRPWLIVLGLIVAKAACDIVLQGIARASMTHVSPAAYLGVFCVPTLAACWVVSATWRRRARRAGAPDPERRPSAWALVAIPLTWFVASIPESYSLATVPIFVFLAIGVVTILMDAGSDWYHDRVRFGARSMAFLILVLSGIGLTIVAA